MQNFTLGRKGLNWFLFTFILFVGTLSSFGQDCANVTDEDDTVAGNQQSFCYLQTVDDISRSGTNTAIFETANTENDTDPIPSDELLTNGVTYYVGSTTEDCNRVAVTARVTAAQTPQNSITNGRDSFTISPCESSGYDAEELEALFTADSGYEIEVYDSEFGTTPMSNGDPLIAGESYFVGQVDANTEDSDDLCPSTRAAVGFDPTEAPSPIADSTQDFCKGATVADLVANGTEDNTQAIRWYRSRNANTPLADNTLLISGEDYFASQIVNDRNDNFPPCETEMAQRTEVIVTILPSDAGPDNTDNVLCVSEADSQLNNTTNARNFFLSLLSNNNDSDTENDVPTDGAFSDDSLAQIVDDYTDGTKVGTYETTYSVTFDNGCTDTVDLAVRVEEDPYAGENTEETVCITDFEPFLSLLPLSPIEEQGVQAAIRNYIESTGTITPGGTFSPSITDLFNQINDDFENNNFPTTYTVTYTVNNGGCMDSSELILNVQSANDAGEDNSDEQCVTDVQDSGIFNTEASLRAYYTDLLGADDTDGDFNPSLSSLIAAYDNGNGIDGDSEDFTTTYTVDGNSECDPASATATLTINAAIEAEAGTADENYEFCSNDSSITLADLIDGENPDGVFSSDDADVADGTFDPTAEGTGNYEITYTVSPETACVSNTEMLTFTITVNQAPNAGPGGDFVFCEAEFMALAAQAATNPSALLEEFGPDITTDGEFSNDDLTTLLIKYEATTSFPATFTTTYTVSNDDCTDSADYTITINPNEEANAGGDQSATFCTTDGMVDLSGSIGAGATTGGTFMSDDLSLTGSTFDASAAGAGTFTVTYTVDETTDPCITGTETATITVTVSEGFELGDDVSMTVCENDLEADYFTVENLTAEFTALLPADAPDGTFSPEISELVQNYNDGMTTGDFSTTYSIEDGECEDSVGLTITVRENIDADLTEVEDPAPICQNAGVQTLTDFIGDNPDLGMFDGYEDGTFDPSMMAAGDYEITYTLSEDEVECVSGTGSISFTISVLDSANAGADMEIEVCQNDGVQDLFDLLEGDTVDTDGTFTFDGDTIENGMMDPADFDAGTYEVTYTVASENDCGNDTATFMITVNMSPDAGMDMAFEVCQNAGVQDLFAQLDDATSDEGSFTYDGDIITDGEMNPADFDAGTYTVTYTLSNENCTDTADFVITVLDAANAGMNMDLTVCMNDDVQNLFDFISVDADDNGEFTLDGEVIADGMMDPADFEAGEYTVIYTVAAINDCGDDTSEFTITVQEAPDAPTVEGDPFTFCATDGATAAELSATGTNLTYYSDEALSMMVAAEDVLVDGTYYVTQRNDDGTCESAAAAFTVTINDAATPTIANTTQEFCEFDDATIADLTELINETGTITWYDSADGDNALNSGTSLQDGVTYYATLFNVDTGCESSVRLGVTVSINDDCPLTIPEGFSPNDDQLNDRFEIKNIRDKYPNFTLEIRNRFGDVVYKGNANTPDWDGFSTEGSFGSDVLPVGAYFYYLRYNDGSTEPVRGTVYLSR